MTCQNTIKFNKARKDRIIAKNGNCEIAKMILYHYLKIEVLKMKSARLLK